MNEVKRKAIEKAVSDNNGELPSWAAAIRSGEHTITRDEFYQVKAEMQNKPSWGDAPEWAEWLGQNANGFWTWYEDEPHKVEPEKDFFVGHFESRSHSARKLPANSRGGVIGDWRDTLEERPKPNLDELSEREPTPELRELMRGNWHERGELPPVGAECYAEFIPNSAMDKKQPDGACLIKAYNNNQVWLQWQHGEEFINRVENLDFRPLRTDRYELVERIADDLYSEMDNPVMATEGESIKIDGWVSLSDFESIAHLMGWRPPKN